MRNFITIATATLVLALAATPAPADLVLFSLEASASPTGPFSSSLSVVANQTYYYEVIEQFEPIGSTANGHTLTSLDPTKDGVNAFSFKVTDNGNSIATFNAGTLRNGYGNGLGASGGTADGNGGLTGVRGAESGGVFVGASGPTVVLSGTFTTPSSFSPGQEATIGLIWGGASSGFKINGGTSLLATTSTETGATPYFGYSGLTLIAVPEPPSMILLGTSLALTGLVAARRRRPRLASASGLRSPRPA